MSVDSKCGKSFLCMGSKDACKINRTRPFRSVKAPYPFDRQGIHIHGLCAIAPAGCHGKGNGNPFFFKFFRTCRCFPHTADGSIRNHHFHRLTIGIFQVFSKKLRCGFCHIHGLLFQRFPYLQIPSSSVNGRPDTYYRIIPNHSVFCHFLLPP